MTPETSARIQAIQAKRREFLQKVASGEISVCEPGNVMPKGADKARWFHRTAKRIKVLHRDAQGASFMYECPHCLTRFITEPRKVEV